MASLKNNTTFNRSNAKGQSNGFYTRSLFGFVARDGALDLVTENTGWIDTLDFDGIDWIINQSLNSQGDNKLPPEYWLLGKTIRISGEAVIRGNDGSGEPKYLNMRFGIKEQSTPTTTWLAVQNNENNHVFVDSVYDTQTDLPISFRCIITCPYYDPTADPANIYFLANGYMHYDRLNWNSAGANNDRTYVPLWKGTSATSVTDIYYTSQTSIMFNFYGSTVQNIYLTRLLIEELA